MKPVTPSDFELLSAYADSQLAPADRAAFEARLSAEPELRAALDELRSLVAALHELPNLRAPRDFRVTAAQVRPVKRVAVFPAVVSGLSAVAAAVLLIVGLGLLRPLTLSTPLVVEQNAVAAAPTISISDTPVETAAARMMEAALTPSVELTASLPETGGGSGIMEAALTPDAAFFGETESAAADGAAGADMELQSGSEAEAGLADLAQAQGGAPAGAAPAPETLTLPNDAANDALQLAPPAAAPEHALSTMAADEEATRTKEGTPTPTMSPTATATPTPTSTLEPTAPPSLERDEATTASVRGESISLNAVALIAGGLVLLAISLWFWRRARRSQ